MQMRHTNFGAKYSRNRRYATMEKDFTYLTGTSASVLLRLLRRDELITKCQTQEDAFIPVETLK